MAVVREASDYIRALQPVCFVASAVHDIRSSPAIVYTDLSLNTAQPCQSVMLDYQIHKLCKPCSVRKKKSFYDNLISVLSMKIQQTFDPVVHLLKNMHKACCLLCEKYAQSVLFIRAVSCGDPG